MQLMIGNRMITIPDSKKYSFPKDIFIKVYDTFAVIVSPQNANWIVLETQEQINIFKLLMEGETIGKVLRIFPANLNDIHKVIQQIEGRAFDSYFISEEENFSLRIYITNKCNLRCKHCFVYASDSYADELTCTEIIDLITRCNLAKCNKLILTGGEVTLRKELGDIVAYAHGLGMYVQVLSNGTLWNQTAVDRLSSYIDEIQISIDGFDEKSNASVRGKGVMENALRAVDMFARTDRTFVNVVVTPMYESLKLHFNSYVDFARKLIAKYSQDRFLIYFQGELIDGRDIKADFQKNIEHQLLVNRLHEILYENSELTTFVMHHKYHRIHNNCGYGGLTVDSVGNVYFCSRIYDVAKYGNIRNDDFQTILDMRKKVREATQVGNLKPCDLCELRYICGGGCRVKNFPDAVQMSFFELVNEKKIDRIIDCNEKDKIYRLMIESVDYLLE